VKLEKVVTDASLLSVSHKPVRDGKLSGYEISVKPGPRSENGYFEGVLSLESGSRDAPPFLVRVYGAIARTD
jgi:hypothetical protein